MTKTPPIPELPPSASMSETASRHLHDILLERLRRGNLDINLAPYAKQLNVHETALKASIQESINALEALLAEVDGPATDPYIECPFVHNALTHLLNVSAFAKEALLAKVERRLGANVKTNK